MDIQHFINTRKALGLSQKELSEGICTQATLSRFENNGQIPTVKILVQLCDRLNIGLGELFPEVSVEEDEINQKLIKAEFNLILQEYQESEQILATIDQSQLTDQTQSWSFDYLKGYLIALQKGSSADAVFYFNRMISEIPKEQVEILGLLAYTGMGMVYENIGEIEKAEYFFNKAVSEVYQIPIQETHDVWRMLNILYYCGSFYANIKDYQTSDALLKHGIEIYSNHHVTYYLARLTFQLAKNAFAQNKAPQEIVERYYDTKAFAKINRNIIELKGLEAFKEELASAPEFKNIYLY